MSKVFLHLSILLPTGRILVTLIAETSKFSRRIIPLDPVMIRMAAEFNRVSMMGDPIAAKEVAHQMGDRVIAMINCDPRLRGDSEFVAIDRFSSRTTHIDLRFHAARV